MGCKHPYKKYLRDIHLISTALHGASKSTLRIGMSQPVGLRPGLRNVGAFAILLSLSGCSGGQTAPATTPAANVETPSPSPTAGSQGTQARPQAVAPGGVGYEDKPGNRGRGR